MAVPYICIHVVVVVVVVVVFCVHVCVCVCAEQHRYAQVRVVGSDGSFLGVMSRGQALARAREESLDLVVIQEDGDVPVCKVISYSKYRYQKEKARKEMRKKSRSHRQAVKELKVRVGIGINDYNVRLRAAKKFLSAGDKVKMSIQFRGREVVFANLGKDLLEKFAGEVAELSVR